MRSVGFSGTYRLNQIANYAFVEWADNIAISDNAPNDYFPDLFNSLTDQEKANASYWHALPDQWHNLEYLDFIAQRRKLIADVIRDGFKVLTGDVIPNKGAKAEPSVALDTFYDLRIALENATTIYGAPVHLTMLTEVEFASKPLRCMNAMTLLWAVKPNPTFEATCAKSCAGVSTPR